MKFKLAFKLLLFDLKRHNFFKGKIILKSSGKNGLQYCYCKKAKKKCDYSRKYI